LLAAKAQSPFVSHVSRFQYEKFLIAGNWTKEKKCLTNIWLLIILSQRFGSNAYLQKAQPNRRAGLILPAFMLCFFMPIAI